MQMKKLLIIHTTWNVLVEYGALSGSKSYKDYNGQFNHGYGSMSSHRLIRSVLEILYMKKFSSTPWKKVVGYKEMKDLVERKWEKSDSPCNYIEIEIKEEHIAFFPFFSKKE